MRGVADVGGLDADGVQLGLADPANRPDLCVREQSKRCLEHGRALAQLLLGWFAVGQWLSIERVPGKRIPQCTVSPTGKCLPHDLSRAFFPQRIIAALLKAQGTRPRQAVLSDDLDLARKGNARESTAGIACSLTNQEIAGPRKGFQVASQVPSADGCSVTAIESRICVAILVKDPRSLKVNE